MNEILLVVSNLIFLAIGYLLGSLKKLPVQKVADDLLDDVVELKQKIRKTEVSGPVKMISPEKEKETKDEKEMKNRIEELLR